MRILVIGSGGREHALVRALRTEEVHAAPGNPGIEALAQTHPDVAPAPDQVVALARKLSPDLVVIGPEAPLVAGAADALREAGFGCFGPGAAAARIEGSKSFAKQVMAEAGIPTAASFTCTGEAEADQALAAFGPPYVVKDDALAAGKGVLVTTDLAAARAHARACGTVVIEEFLDGPEVSLFAVTDGVTAVPLLPAQDFKRAGDGDQGPNTGGMGAYAPLPWAAADLAEQTMAEVIAAGRGHDAPPRHAVPGAALRRPGADLGRAAGGGVQRPVRRPGDAGGAGPAEQPARAAADRRRGQRPASASRLEWRPGAAVVVVIAAEGYPEKPVKGEKIEVIDTERGGVSGLGTDEELEQSERPRSIVCTRGRPERRTVPW